MKTYCSAQYSGRRFQAGNVHKATVGDHHSIDVPGMSGYLDWKFISEGQVAQLEACCVESEVKRLLHECFNVANYPLEKQTVLVDFHFQNYAFCKRSAFDARQTSTFMSIMVTIFSEDAASNTLLNNANLSFRRFQTLLLKHSVERPPKSVQIFQPSDVEPIVNFAIESYFRNYNLYSYIFGVQTLLTVKQLATTGIEYPHVAPPLHAGKLVQPEPAAADQQ